LIHTAGIVARLATRVTRIPLRAERAPRYCVLLLSIAALAGIPAEADSLAPSSPAVSVEPATPGTAEGTRPADLRPRADLLLPGWRGTTFHFGALAPAGETATTLVPSRDLLRAPFDASVLRTLQDSGLSAQVMKRMRREARLDREDGIFDPADPLAPFDSIAERQRSRQAERIVTRSLHRTVDQRLEESLRLTPGLGRFLSWIEGARSGRTAPGPADPAAPAAAMENGATVAPDLSAAGDGERTSVLRFKLDAHPRLVWRTRFAGLQGRVEVPLRNEPLRFSLERPLGPRCGAALHGGLARDGADWATLTLHLRF
jgi:hypothetical protein